MASRFGAAQPIADAMRTMPQTVIEGLLGQNMGQKVEGWLGMPLGATGATQVDNPDPNYQRQMLNTANQSFMPQAKPSPRRGFLQR